MKENEDGFIPVEQCVEALSSPPRYFSEHSGRFVDLRRSDVRRLRAVAHPGHTYQSSRLKRVFGSFQFRYAISSCEDIDKLILALTAAKKLTT